MILEGAVSREDLGQHFGGTLHAREIDWLVTHEWATSADDILWRRSKLGLVLTAAEASALDSHLGGTLRASAGDNVAVAE